MAPYTIGSIPTRSCGVHSLASTDKGLPMRYDGLDLELCCADEDLRSLAPTALGRRRIRAAVLASVAAFITMAAGLVVAGL